MNNCENIVLTEIHPIENHLIENHPIENHPIEKPIQKVVRLVDVVVSDENIALNLMVGFLSLGQKRGVFSLDESAKIWECVKAFQKSQPSS